MCNIEYWSGDEGGEQVVDFVAGQGDPPEGRRSGVSFGGRDDGEECVGEHPQDCPAVPRGPEPDLVLIKPGETFAGLERFLDCPPAACDLNQDSQWNGAGRVAAVERQLAGGAVATDQQPPVSARLVGVDVGERPVVVAIPRPAMRVIICSNITAHRSGFTLEPAATSRSGLVHTTDHDQLMGRTCI
ncbi:hypothetical protein AB0I53_20215 [Saccharopolyspora sp. NPDC050389]|uniref:hypothetical protein n=1 Tax=Saccharopolyspora sp. NPDC050389 TaxID=3155516 RepID=UPI0033F44B52